MNVTDDGILLIDKPMGWTSFDVVAKIRGTRRAAFKAQGIAPTKRQLRVGHAGTLDPFATGLLIILLGDATKRSDEFLKQDKTYEATVTLGATSSTGDLEGDITPVSDAKPNDEAIQATLSRFTGPITQIPPAYSAIKINGQRAYKLARKGQDIEIPSRQVTIHALEVLSYEYPELKIRTHVSSGTYIRSLAQDIGEALGTGAYCNELRRTQIGDMDITQATEVSKVTSID
jgi:tRNA pseudouridine55 synthase